MARQARLLSSKGLLIVEAVLAAVVIAVGLTFITRGLGSQMRALRSIEEYDRLMPLAQGKLLELEAKRISDISLSASDQEGSFGEPNEKYGWKISKGEEISDSDGKPIAIKIAISVQRSEGALGAVTLYALWRADWIPAEWR